MKKNKLLFLVQLPPPVHGASLMNETIVKNSIVNTLFEIDTIQIQLAGSMKDMGGFAIRKIVNALRNYLKLFFRLIRYKYDVVYFTLSPLGLAFYKDLFLVLILKLFNQKIVYHLHGKGILEKTTKSRIQKKLYQYVFNNTEVIMLADVLYKDISNVFSKKPYILHNGIPVNTNMLAKQNIKPLSFVYLSNLVKSKGILVFLEALKILKNRNANFEATIVGNTADVSIEELKEIVNRYHLEKTVNIHGPAYGKDKYKILSQSDVFVLPTYYKNECFPLTIIEAYQSGLAVISTDNGAISDMVQHGKNGFLVDKKDPEDLALKMLYCIDNPDIIHEMTDFNKNEFNEKYTEEIFIKNFIDIINSILKK